MLRAAVDWSGCHGPWRPRPGAGRLPAGRVMYCREAGRPGGWKAARPSGGEGATWPHQGGTTHPPSRRTLAFHPIWSSRPFPQGLASCCKSRPGRILARATTWPHHRHQLLLIPTALSPHIRLWRFRLRWDRHWPSFSGAV